MTKKTMRISTGVYLFCALVWTINFFLHWHQDGRIEVSTALFGVSAVCFLIAGLGGVFALRRARKEEHQEEQKHGTQAV